MGGKGGELLQTEAEEKLIESVGWRDEETGDFGEDLEKFNSRHGYAEQSTQF